MVSENFSWVYPPANVPAETIGPVHLYDTIALSWTPASLYIAPPYKLQMACRLANQSYVFVPITNVSSPHLFFFKENYDTQPYPCWYGFETPPDGTGETDAAFTVVPTTAATAITFSATSSPSSAASPTSSMQITSTPATATTPAAATDATTPSETGLSSGAKAGIGVGVAFGAIGLVALVIAILFFRRRSSRREAAQNMPEVDQEAKHPYDKPPLAYAEAEAPYPYVEADVREARHELQ